LLILTLASAYAIYEWRQDIRLLSRQILLRLLHLLGKGRSLG